MYNNKKVHTGYLNTGYLSVLDKADADGFIMVVVDEDVKYIKEDELLFGENICVEDTQ